MRATFGIILAGGVVAALGWSLMRRATDTDDSARKQERLVSQDPVDGEDPLKERERQPLSQDPPPPRPAADPAAHAHTDAADPDAAARRLLALARSDFLDQETRTRALDVASRLCAAADAESATRTGVERRIAARRLCGAVYDAETATREDRDRAFTMSRALFEILVRGNGAPPELAIRHKVEPGQSVWALAKGPWKRAGVTVAPGFVLWVNGVADARRLRTGQTLRVPLESLNVVVRKSTFDLTVFLGGAPVERFAVAVGADAKTPVGLFRATDCIKNPDWYQNGRRIPFGSTGHIIGTRWIGFAGAPGADGIGIHGTNDDATIGKAVSQGCVRMRNTDVETLFEWIAAGTPIEIRD